MSERHNGIHLESTQEKMRKEMFTREETITYHIGNDNLMEHGNNKSIFPNGYEKLR